MTAISNHSPTKRRNVGPWMESRLRRLDAKLAHSYRWANGQRIPLTEEELNRCRDRAHRLANDIQALWAKRSARQMR